ncbi:hypothetical protein DICVIV_02169 [Dictyocaulus viviparus]|uniref:START domain-containing protein n=1 Tax=Dictyocaulus viviparus TaxID=29172 RepID=A0A0D8Y423_DICVI|nr:hypothetical protein DICVIV_02169 [Dictyocaulus viviparus]
MSTVVKLLDIEDSTSNAQYGAGLRSTANAFVEALKMFDDVKHADRKEWKLKTEHKGDKCFNKVFPIGKVYYLKKIYNMDMEALFQHHWDEIEKTPEWNSNVHSVERLETISKYADILHYTTSEVIAVKDVILLSAACGERFFFFLIKTFQSFPINNDCFNLR